MIGLLCSFLTLLLLVPADAESTLPVDRRRIKSMNQYLVSFQTGDRVQKIADLSHFGFVGSGLLASLSQLPAAKVEFSRPNSLGYKTTISINRRHLSDSLWNRIVFQKDFQVHPNYIYVGENWQDKEESSDFEPTLSKISDDPKSILQYHHWVMGNDLAWNFHFEQDSKILVAVIDDGVDVLHEDLKANIAINTDEIPDNNLDDDRNGFIDDVLGWDFAEDDADVYPEGRSHGTHISGIIAAEIDNGLGGAGGAALAAKILPIRFFNGQFSSLSLGNSIQYAVDRGAKIIVLSYRMDELIGDAFVREIIRYAYDQGAIIFNSAGNDLIDNPPRVAFKENLVVCNTVASLDNRNDRLWKTSSYGEGVDLCAPGAGHGGIFSTVPHNRYKRKSGTSMSAPNAAVVAALIWSQNPNWSRDQVVTQLLATCDPIQAKDKNLIGKTGCGRVNSLRALTEKIASPEIIGIKGLERGLLPVTRRLSLRPSHPLDPKTLRSKNFILTSESQTLKVRVKPNYKMGSNFVELIVPRLKPGRYNLEISKNVSDVFGQSLTNRNFKFKVYEPLLPLPGGD